MIFLNKKKHNVDSSCIEVTKSFLSFLSNIVKDNSIDISSRQLLNSSKEACMELYRHVLCISLELTSTLGYSELEVLVDNAVNHITCDLNRFSILNKSDSYKKGFVEACMHCIVMSRNFSRGDS